MRILGAVSLVVLAATPASGAEYLLGKGVSQGFPEIDVVPPNGPYQIDISRSQDNKSCVVTVKGAAGTATTIPLRHCELKPRYRGGSPLYLYRGPSAILPGAVNLEILAAPNAAGEVMVRLTHGLWSGHVLDRHLGYKGEHVVVEKVQRGGVSHSVHRTRSPAGSVSGAKCTESAASGFQSQRLRLPIHKRFSRRNARLGL